jgi:hypothetical protein
MLYHVIVGFHNITSIFITWENQYDLLTRRYHSWINCLKPDISHRAGASSRRAPAAVNDDAASKDDTLNRFVHKILLLLLLLSRSS